MDANFIYAHTYDKRIGATFFVRALPFFCGVGTLVISHHDKWLDLGPLQIACHFPSDVLQQLLSQFRLFLFVSIGKLCVLIQMIYQKYQFIWQISAINVQKNIFIYFHFAAIFKHKVVIIISLCIIQARYLQQYNIRSQMVWLSSVWPLLFPLPDGCQLAQYTLSP